MCYHRCPQRTHRIQMRLQMQYVAATLGGGIRGRRKWKETDRVFRGAYGDDVAETAIVVPGA